jgi:hypothetical protein
MKTAWPLIAMPHLPEGNICSRTRYHLPSLSLKDESFNAMRMLVYHGISVSAPSPSPLGYEK